MFDIYNPIQTPENDPMKGLSDDERIKVCLLQLVGFFGTMVAAFFILAVISLFTGCSTPKVIEHHHHHYEQADTLAIQSRIDRALNSWHEQMDSSWRQSWKEYSASLFRSEDEKEHITETITTYIDSLGREVRQEQRTTDRSLSKMQQQTEQRLTREFETRLSVAVDSVNDLWQQRFDALQSHLEKSDSTSNSVQPAGVLANDNLPWYKRWWQSLKDRLLAVAIIALLLMTHNIWLPWCIDILRRILKGGKE
jgi:hypothetical protein